MVIFLRAPDTKTVPDRLMVQDMAVLLKPHARARRLILRYDAKQRIFQLTLPKRASKKAAIAFLNEQTPWMQRQIRVTPPVPDAVLLPGAILPVLGIDRVLIHERGIGIQTDLQPDRLIIRCRETRFARAVRQFMMDQAAQVITPLAHAKAASIGQNIHAVGYRDTTSRWGSCSHDGRLGFSWRLVMAPMAVIDYVVAHEVAHLQHFDHSPAFWALCRLLATDFTLGKHWLRVNGPELHRVL